MKYSLAFLLGFLLLLACSDDGGEPPVVPSDVKVITSFAFLRSDNPALAQDYPATIVGDSITCTFPAGTDVTALKPFIGFDGAGITPGDGIAGNFSSPLTYSVAAEDGSSRIYTVKVTVTVVVQPVDISGVYVSGTQLFVTTHHQMLWKNGVGYKVSDGHYNSAAEGIALDDRYAYLCGTTQAGMGVAGYTKVDLSDLSKFTGINLTNGTTAGSAWAIVMSGKDLYVLGGDGTDGKSKVWKNGVIHALEGNVEGGAFGLAVDGTSVYAAGYEVGTANYVLAKWWNNGTPFLLSNDDEICYAQAVCVYKGDVYVAGKMYLERAFRLVVWKNGAVHWAPRGGDPVVDITDIFVSDRGVFIAGAMLHGNDMVATVWKNQDPHPLSTSRSLATSVYVHNDDVYVTGNLDRDPDNDFNHTAYLWKNGDATCLSKGAPFAYAGQVIVR